MESIIGSNDITRQRVDLVRDLCTGPGWTDEVLEARQSEILETFGGYDQDTFNELLNGAVDAMPDTPFKAALLNAIQESDGKNLTERRSDFLEKNGSMSTRTLMRHEQEGAELLVQFFGIIEGNYLRMKEDEASEDATRDADIEVLRRRVSKLEEALVEKTESIEALSTKIDDASKLEANIQEVHSLIEQQNKSLTAALQRISDLEIMLYCYSQHVNEVLFLNALEGFLSGKEYKGYPTEYSFAWNAVSQRARERISEEV